MNPRSGPLVSRRLVPLVLVGSLALNSYGMSFGLPYRWNIDETVAAALRVGAERSLIRGDIRQTHFHTYVLTLFLTPYALYASATRPDFPAIRTAASQSWNRLADIAPDFAESVYRQGRFLSAAIGTATVFVVYRLTAVLWGPLAGVMAAALLAMTQGFVGSNHLARSEPLVNFFGALVMYLLVRSLGEGPRRFRYFSLAAFFAGLAFATKFNGLVLIGAVGLTWLSFAWQARSQATAGPIWTAVRAAKWKWVAPVAGLYALGILVGQPTILDFLFHGREVLAYWNLYFTGKTAPSAVGVHLVNYLVQLVVIYGVPFAACIAAGLVVFVMRHRRSSSAPGAWLLLATSAAYLLVTSTYPFAQPWIKFIIFIVPLLAVFGGLALAELATWLALPAAVRVLSLVAVFGYGLALTLSLDGLLVRDDVRYASTRWIESNIPRGSSIEHFQEEAWLYSARIVPSYDVIYVGRHSRDYEGSLFRQGDIAAWDRTKREYLTSRLADGPDGDFFILWVEDLAALQGVRANDGLPEAFVRAMSRDELGYRLVYRIQSRNYKVPVEWWPGLYVPHSLWWHPVIDYVPTEIRIYKRERPAGSVAPRRTVDEGHGDQPRTTRPLPLL